MQTISLPSPAKINHFLHIVGQREDGYHLLQTLFQFIDFGDTLHFEIRNDGAVKIDGLKIPESENIVYRTAMALKQISGADLGISIRIEKNIPICAGLGGGSSNAATALLALNKLWEINWPREKLLTLGSTLGADIPIFIHGHTAFGEGIGEQLTPIKIDERWILILIPPCQILTKGIFNHPQLTRNTPRLKISTLIRGDFSFTLDGLRNDFEPLVRQLYPQVDAAMNWLSNFGKAQLSGSGSSVFACFNSYEQANKVLDLLPEEFQGFVAKAVNTSPLMKAIDHFNR